jgi:ABC-type sugar transport system substrate-binding protein
MRTLRSIGLAAAAASFVFVSIGAGLWPSTTAAHAESVDVSKDGWWLKPYTASKEWTIGVSYTDVSISYIAALQKAVQAKAKEIGVKIIEVDAKNDTNVELANVESLIQQHIDLLLLEGASLKASVASIEAANKANVPVVHFNILAEGGHYVTFVGSNQIESGIDMGIQIVKLYKQLGKPKLKGIYMRGIAGYITDEIRNRGVKDTLAKAGLGDKIEWTEQYADFSRAKAQAVAESILAKSQDYDFIIANGDDMILGALGAVKAAGLLGKVLVYTSVDGLPETLDAIKAGEIVSTIFQNPEGQGEGGIMAATMYLDGDKNLPEEILIPFVPTDKSNVDEIMKIADRVYGK